MGADTVSVQSSAKRLTVFYDGACPKCVADRQRYEAMAGADGEDIDWFDITGRASELRALHVRDGDQIIVSALDAYILLMWRVPGLKTVARLIGMPVIRPLLASIYHWKVERRLRRSGRL